MKLRIVGVVVLGAFLTSTLGLAVIKPIGRVVAITKGGKVWAINKQSGARMLTVTSQHDQASAAAVFGLAEEIKTAPNTSAQLALNDGSLITLRGNTRYLVSDLVVDQQDPTHSKSTGNLLQGVLTSLSYGKRHVLKTPLTTIAIRGTLFESGVIFNKCSKRKPCAVRCPGQDSVYGWTLVDDGALDITSALQETRPKSPGRSPKALLINAKNPQANAAVYRVCGKLRRGMLFEPRVETATMMVTSKAQIQSHSSDKLTPTLGPDSSVVASNVAVLLNKIDATPESTVTSSNTSIMPGPTLPISPTPSAPSCLSGDPECAVGSPSGNSEENDEP